MDRIHILDHILGLFVSYFDVGSNYSPHQIVDGFRNRILLDIIPYFVTIEIADMELCLKIWWKYENW